MFLSSSTINIQPLRQLVTLENRQRSDILCENVSCGVGTAGSTATFVVPNLDWDSPKKVFIGKFITVEVKYRNDITYRRLFNGYVTSIEGSSGDRHIRLIASSYIAISDKVYLGSENKDYEAGFPSEYFFNGTFFKTEWNIPKILINIFSESAVDWRHGIYGNANLPSAWRQRLLLGNMAALNDYYNKVEIGEIIWRRQTLRGALDELLGLIGTVTFKERHDGNRTFLDFGEIGDYRKPRKNLFVAKCNESIEGKNIASITNVLETEELITSLSVQGENRKILITIDENSGALIPLWNREDENKVYDAIRRTQGNQYLGLVNEDIVEFEGYTEEEQLAIYKQAFEKIIDESNVFKKYKINPDFFSFNINEDNILDYEINGEVVRLPIQGFIDVRYPLFIGENIMMTDPNDPGPNISDDKKRDALLLSGYFEEVPLNTGEEVGAFVPLPPDRLKIPSWDTVRNDPTLWTKIDWSKSALLFWGKDVVGQYKLIEVEIDMENLIVTFAEPALLFRSMVMDKDGAATIAYDRANAHLSICLDGPRIKHLAENKNDTPIDGIDIYQEVIENNSFRYIQFTNNEFPINGKTYPFIYYVNNIGWRKVEEKQIIRDDREQLKYFSEQALKEKIRPSISYEIEVPFFTDSYNLLDLIDIKGDDGYYNDTHTILDVTYNLTNDHSVSISTSNQISNQYYSVVTGG
jgi:hypothetical protein